MEHKNFVVNIQIFTEKGVYSSTFHGVDYLDNDMSSSHRLLGRVLDAHQ